MSDVSSDGWLEGAVALVGSDENLQGQRPGNAAAAVPMGGGQILIQPRYDLGLTMVGLLILLPPMLPVLTMDACAALYSSSPLRCTGC